MKPVSYINHHCENGYSGPGWYFYDESSNIVGPYAVANLAQAAQELWSREPDTSVENEILRIENQQLREANNGARHRLVLLESPYAGDVDTNLMYLRAAMRDCLLNGEAPYASHGLYTQPGVLDDGMASERQLGIEAGLSWGSCADATVVYTDLGISKGMQLGIDHAKRLGRRVEYRTLPNWRKP